MRSLRTEKILIAALALALTVAACQPGATNTNATNTTNTNANSTNTTSVTNANDATSSPTAFETREPSQYQATLVITTAATNKGQAMSLPTMQVARSGDNRRYSISNLPAIGEVVFLDRADKRYVVLPTRKQYLELGAGTTGFDVRSLTPAQMVDRLKNQPGVTRVGDDTVNGRSVIKYRYAAAGHTATQAGDVQAENYVYVDKDTGLPIKVETAVQSSGNVAGASQGHLVAELRDLTTTVDPTLFDPPQGYTQITQEQMKQYMQTLATVFQFVMQGMNNMGGGGSSGGNGSSGTTATPGSSPVGTASPAPTRP
jgi:hypothetical protein